jgi:hypothetical protein
MHLQRHHTYSSILHGVDDQFRAGVEMHGSTSNTEGVPIQLTQGHPEAPRLWHQHIHSILQEEVSNAVHEPCLYFRNDVEEKKTDEGYQVYLKDRRRFNALFFG